MEAFTSYLITLMATGSPLRLRANNPKTNTLCHPSGSHAFTPPPQSTACPLLLTVCHTGGQRLHLMLWIPLKLGSQFDIEGMAVTISEEKLRDTLSMVGGWSRKTIADIHKVRSLLGHLFHMVQCSHPTRLFVNCMLKTLRACPASCHMPHSHKFKKDIAWFIEY